MLNEGIQMLTFIGTVSVRTFLILFYYSSGSATAKSSYISGSATLILIDSNLLWDDFRSLTYQYGMVNPGRKSRIRDSDSLNSTAHV